MGSALIFREGYDADYVLFLNSSNTDWRVESMSPDFTVQLTSEVDSTETLQVYLDKHATLALSVGSAMIAADGVQSSLISLNPPQNASVRIMRYNILIHEGNTPDGAVLFKTTDAAEYYFELQSANGQTGYAKVIAYAS